MTGYVLTWNPARSQLDDARWSRWVERMWSGGRVETAWRMGSTRHGVTGGERVFVLRQGAHGRGLVGRGEVVEDGVQPDDEWDGTGRMAFHVRVTWTDGVGPADATPVDVLEHVTTSFDWRHVYASGHRLTEPDVAALDAPWGAVH